jgi:hypothetical protein
MTYDLKMHIFLRIQIKIFKKLIIKQYIFCELNHTFNM